MICAQVEAELVELEDDERAEFLDSLGLEQSGPAAADRPRPTRCSACSRTSPPAPRRRAPGRCGAGSTAPTAAGVIHTDFERGFIRAEVISYDDLDTLGSEAAARDAGRLRFEGKEYVVADGDVIHFRFNV